MQHRGEIAQASVRGEIACTQQERVGKRTGVECALECKRSLAKLQAREHFQRAFAAIAHFRVSRRLCEGFQPRLGFLFASACKQLGARFIVRNQHWGWVFHFECLCALFAAYGFVHFVQQPCANQPRDMGAQSSPERRTPKW
jgi:hypothetical protein